MMETAVLAQIQSLYKTTGLPALVYKADGSLIWQNAVSSAMGDTSVKVKALPAMVQSMAAIGERIPYRSLSDNLMQYTAVPMDGGTYYLITAAPTARQDAPDIGLAIRQSSIHFGKLMSDLLAGVLGLEGVSDLYEDDEGYHLLHRLNQNCLRLIAAKENLTTYFALTSGQDYPLTGLDLGTFTESLAQALETKVRMLPHCSVSYTATGSAFPILGNQELLQQAILCLVDNSLKSFYTDDDFLLRISLSRNGGDAVLTIADNGISISPEYADRVFEPFFTLDDSHRSLGLGLTIAKMIVERFDGRILTSFKEGFGTTITLIFPLREDLPLCAAELPSGNMFRPTAPLHTQLADVVMPPMP